VLEKRLQRVGEKGKRETIKTPDCSNVHSTLKKKGSFRADSLSEKKKLTGDRFEKRAGEKGKGKRPNLLARGGGLVGFWGYQGVGEGKKTTPELKGNRNRKQRGPFRCTPEADNYEPLRK